MSGAIYGSLNLLSILLIFASVIVAITGFIWEFSTIKILLIVISLIVGLAIRFLVVSPVNREAAELKRKYGNPK